MTITESKKFTNDDGSFHYKKHKIYLYKEDFSEFQESLNDMIQYIIDEKGNEVISERHQKDFKKESDMAPTEVETAAEEPSSNSFTDVNFDDI